MLAVDVNYIYYYFSYYCGQWSRLLSLILYCPAIMQEMFWSGACECIGVCVSKRDVFLLLGPYLHKRASWKS